MSLKLNFILKEDENCLITDLQKVSPDILIVLGFLVTFCNDRGLPCRITNITGTFGKSQSKTHISGRALDVGIKGWRPIDIADCEVYLIGHVGHLGAYSSRDQKQRLFVYGDPAHRDHIHLQTRRR